MYATAMIAALIIAVTTWYWVKLPSLCRGLPANFSDAERAFRERIRAKFQLGMPETDMLRVLNAQGFGPPVTYNGSKGVTYSAFFFPCDVTWWVVWRADANGRIREIDGSYGGTCP